MPFRDAVGSAFKRITASPTYTKWNTSTNMLEALDKQEEEGQTA
ncbi:MAG TPA: hypothetical protein QGF95_14920 [Candidatus Latescibacteria bacterium]|nr:hypothetical protein [Candidatus Latescibacterota bacterium]